jgi:poly-gamma-glutamate synthesis protein (capsule biosynthesis protein)
MRNVIVFFSIVILVSSLKASAGEKVTFCAAGDVLLDRGCGAKIRQHGFDYLFEPVRDFVRSRDLALSNLEGPLSAKKRTSVENMRFCADSAYVEVLKRSGFDIFCLANNHILDYGRQALLETRSILEINDLVPLGAGKNKSEAVSARIVRKNGCTFAFLAFAAVPYFGAGLNADLPCPAIADSATVRADVEKCRSTADYVIVTFHWGVEYAARPAKEQVQLAHLCIDSGADLVIGHHPHVIQSIEKYRGKFILYSLGNFVFDQHKPEQRESILFACTFREGKVESPHIVPVIIPDLMYRPELAGCADSIRITDRVKALSEGFAAVFRDGDIEVFLE